MWLTVFLEELTQHLRTVWSGSEELIASLQEVNQNYKEFSEGDNIDVFFTCSAVELAKFDNRLTELGCGPIMRTHPSKHIPYMVIGFDLSLDGETQDQYDFILIGNRMEDTDND